MISLTKPSGYGVGLLLCGFIGSYHAVGSKHSVGILYLLYVIFKPENCDRVNTMSKIWLVQQEMLVAVTRQTIKRDCSAAYLLTLAESSRAISMKQRSSFTSARRKWPKESRIEQEDFLQSCST